MTTEKIVDAKVSQTAQEIKEQWDRGKSYQESIGLPSYIKTCVDYYEGRQTSWFPKGLPPITLNVVQQIISNKLSSICEKTIKINYFTNEDFNYISTLNKFTNYITKKIRFNKKMKESAEMALKVGTSLINFYWNENGRCYGGINKGTIEQEVINPLNFIVENPREKDIQKQEYVIFHSRESVRRVKECCLVSGEIEKIKPDRNQVEPEKVEMDKDTIVSVYTKFFRVDGEVYFVKATAEALICEPTPLNPEITLAMIKKARKGETDAPSIKSHDEKLERENDYKVKFDLYPFELLVLQDRDDNYLGISDVYGMITGQNAVNLMYSLALKNGIDIQAKYVVKDKALRNQVITNEIGQTIVDYSNNGNMGITQMTGQATMTNEMLNLPLSLVELIRKLKSATDVSLGDTSKELSGQAIAMLQTASERPTEGLTQKMYDAVERIAGILLLFFKFYYDEETFSYDDSIQDRLERAKKLEIPYEETSATIEDRFSGERIKDKIFDVTVEATGGGKFSQANQLSFINQLIQMKGQLSKSDMRFFIKATPDELLRDKQTMLEMLAQEEMSENEQLKAKVQQLEMLNQQYLGAIKHAGANIKYLQKYNENLQKGFGDEIKYKDNVITKFQNEQSPKEENLNLGLTNGTNAEEKKA